MFENLKKSYVERLQKKTVISEFEGEKVYLSKGSIFSPIPILGKRMREWGQIYPAVDEDTLEVNWVNLIVGGGRNLTKLIIILLLLTVAFYGVMEMRGSAAEILSSGNYVVIEKTSFNKFCSNVPMSDILNNLTIFTDIES